VNFLNHPDLRLLILPDGWQGYPLRKDYEDPVNMIKL
jgi:NADH:ubiquinone oxidoreductase subunit C